MYLGKSHLQDAEIVREERYGRFCLVRQNLEPGELEAIARDTKSRDCLDPREKQLRSSNGSQAVALPADATQHWP